MATIQITRNYNTSGKAMLVFAGKNDTPNITNNNAIFTLQVNWGTGGETTTYSSNSGATGSDSGIQITSSGHVYIFHTPTGSKTLSTYSTTGFKNISVEGGWKNTASDTESYLAFPKQQVTRFTYNRYLNNKKGDIELSVRTQGNEVSKDLTFKFAGDYIGLDSCEVIKLMTGETYSIPTDNSYNFTLITDPDLDAEYTDGVLSTNTKKGFIDYTFEISGVTYTRTFEITSNYSSVAPVANQWSKMTTSKHHIDESAYKAISYNDGSSTKRYTPSNKNIKLTKITLGNNFEIHGEGDFANYKVKKIENSSGHTQTFSGNFDHTFLGCSNLQLSSVIENLNFDTVTGMRGFMSGCTSFKRWGTLNNIGNSVTDLTGALEYSSYNSRNVKNWNVSNVTSVESLFEGTFYNQPGINDWKNKTSNIINFHNMFKNNFMFNRHISAFSINTTEDVDLDGMFYYAKKFNKPVNALNVSKVTSFKNMFKNAFSFNQQVSKFKTGSATSMEGMFYGTESFNRPVNKNTTQGYWDTSSVIKMKSMFKNSIFNKPIKSWDISNVNNLESFMEGNEVFDQIVNNLDISSVKNFKNTFRGTKNFNRGLDNWGRNLIATGPRKISLEGMFQDSVYNKPMIKWEVGNVKSIKNMFKDNTTFQQKLFPQVKLKSQNLKDITGFLDGTSALLGTSNSTLKTSISNFGKKTPGVNGLAKMFGEDDSGVDSSFKGTSYNSARSTYDSGNDNSGDNNSGDRGVGSSINVTDPSNFTISSDDTSQDNFTDQKTPSISWSHSVDDDGISTESPTYDVYLYLGSSLVESSLDLSDDYFTPSSELSNGNYTLKVTGNIDGSSSSEVSYLFEVDLAPYIEIMSDSRHSTWTSTNQVSKLQDPSIQKLAYSLPLGFDQTNQKLHSVFMVFSSESYATASSYNPFFADDHGMAHQSSSQVTTNNINPTSAWFTNNAIVSDSSVSTFYCAVYVFTEDYVTTLNASDLEVFNEVGFNGNNSLWNAHKDNAYAYLHFTAKS